MKTYHYNNNIKEKYFKFNNKKYGILKKYDKEGDLELKTNYFNSIKNGIQIHFTHNIIIDYIPYIKNKINGVCFHESENYILNIVKKNDIIIDYIFKKK
jgi:antitoxin component YwqK of YwqJK toxin-antitoxin module